MTPIESHDEFLELCALSASEELTPSERKKLFAHLATCDACRQAQKQFESLVAGPISALAAEEHVDAQMADNSWSMETAESELFKRLGEESAETHVGREAPEEEFPTVPSLVASQGAWRELWISYAAAILLIVSLAIATYRMGTRHSVVESRQSRTPVTESAAATSLGEQISELSHDRELARLSIVQRDKWIADLKKQLQQQSAELAQIKTDQSELRQEAAVRKSGQDFSFSQRQTELEHKLQQSEAEAQSLRAQLEIVQQESALDSGRVATLQAKVSDLTDALQEKEAEAGQEKQLLAHDRDIRELIGARDLYMAEVYDVARSGETQKPFGRVFYTKEKSLVFYAYDLDQEAGLRGASTFQAWGRRGPDRSQALNLGVFYEDNAAKKRWVLKFNDPRTLAQIDAVFVTIEPDGGSRKPSGKPLLFAYLKMEPNHP